MKALLRVEVQPGLFSSERKITFKTLRGEISLYLDQEEVPGNWMEVEVISMGEDRATVRVPKPSIYGDGTVFCVPTSQIRPIEEKP